MSSAVLCVVALTADSSLPIPPYPGALLLSGVYKSTNTLHEYFKMDPTNFKLDVWKPIQFQNGSKLPDGVKFPLIAYAHGLFGGGLFETAYTSLFSSLSGFGYIVIAPRACPFGCWDSSSLPKDPKGWADYYKQQLKVLDYAHQNLASSVDFGAGIGIAGHSMGGQATLFSSSYSNASSHDIRAAVMHHAYTHEAPAPTVPFLAFTGGKDTTASPAMTQAFYTKTRSGLAKGYVNRADADHMEPTSGTTYNPLLSQFTAAWFKIHLDRASSMEATAVVNGTQKRLKVDVDEIIFGSGPRSVCGGGDNKMVTCETHRN